MSSTKTRREFLKTSTALAALPYFVPSRVLGAGGATLPSEKIVLGCIGVGSMGGGHVRGWSSAVGLRVASMPILLQRAEEISVRITDEALLRSHQNARSSILHFLCPVWVENLRL